MKFFLITVAGLWICRAGAAEFSVSPIRVELARGVRSAAVTVANEDAQPLRMQLRLMEWTQDADGKDVHRESDALVYYPRMMTLQPGEKRLVRVGLKGPAGTTEQAYRLYLDELPRPEVAAVSGVNFTIRFALPVFVPPQEAKPRGAIDSIALRDGRLQVIVSNPGNQSFRIATIAVRGGAFATEAAGWYMLAGATRTHTFDIPPAVCRNLSRLDITVKADRLALQGGLDVDAGMCPR